MATDTRQKILDAATKLFASADSRGASLRSIAREADVNSALVHYHFGSRENLFEATILDALAPIQDRRHQLLTNLRASHPNPEPRDLARLFVDPLIDTGDTDRTADDKDSANDAVAARNAARLRLLARVFSEKRGWVQDLTLKHFGELMYALGDLLGSALPDIPVDTKHRRMQFSVEVALESLASFEEHALASEEPKTSERDIVRNDLIDFLAGGLSAPVSNRVPSRHS